MGNFKVGDKVELIEAKDNLCYSSTYLYGLRAGIVHKVYNGFIRFDGLCNWVCGDRFRLVAAPDIATHEVEPTKKLDSHYDFTYELTGKDIGTDHIKVDPYFVAKQWCLGGKDNTGVLFHILKTIARYGDKNSKSREIKALYLQIKRLAELENITLEG